MTLLHIYLFTTEEINLEPKSLDNFLFSSFNYSLENKVYFIDMYPNHTSLSYLRDDEQWLISY